MKKKNAKPKKITQPKKTGTKKCNGPLCDGKMVPVSKFNKDSTNVTDGLQGTCRDCKKAKADANKEKAKTNRRFWFYFRKYFRIHFKCELWELLIGRL